MVYDVQCRVRPNLTVTNVFSEAVQGRNIATAHCSSILQPWLRFLKTNPVQNCRINFQTSPPDCTTLVPLLPIFYSTKFILLCATPYSISPTSKPQRPFHVSAPQLLNSQRHLTANIYTTVVNNTNHTDVPIVLLSQLYPDIPQQTKVRPIFVLLK